MNELRLPEELVDEMVEHCLAGRPNEACGLLAAAGGEIVKVFRMTNASASPVRYSLDAAEQLAAYKKIEAEGWELGGVYHSHTRTEAYPSPTDIRDAHEDVPYVIVSLAHDPPDVRAFRIVKESWMDEDGRVVEMPVVRGPLNP
ncbi:MAG TPA: M67 family metallopeptidase [Actinomycetota bacterium]|jgi:[CysO sulfur-carrier protein]-S-L-cysteine hydrolase|nr:M67 family metallopeptidase [Actinomycetota bacterium]